jgi:hypothetical protein
VIETPGKKYDIGVECWWIGWKDIDVQQKIANFIAGSLSSAKAQNNKQTEST